MRLVIRQILDMLIGVPVPPVTVPACYDPGAVDKLFDSLLLITYI